jgi:hypothetical protein
MGKNDKKECDHQFITHWWCDESGRFYGDSFDRHLDKGCDGSHWFRDHVRQVRLQDLAVAHTQA